MFKMLSLKFALVFTLSAQALSSGSYYPESLLTNQFASWGIDPSLEGSIDMGDVWKQFKKKSDVVVAVIDTGIQANHPFLKDNLVNTGGNKASQTNYGVDFSTLKATKKPFDSHGHGTHVSGIVKSIFPEVKILSLKYYNPKASGQANLNSTIKALKYAVDNNVDIINYSGGGPEASAAELKVLKEAQRKGILIIAAAGNERSNIDQKQNAYYPASYGLSNIITVGAHDKNNRLISASNWGSKSVDIAAPGKRIKSAIPGSAAGYMTGTSQATAFVTGVASLIKSNHPELNYEQIKNILLSSSQKVSKLAGKVLGSAKLNAKAAIKLANRVSKKLAIRAVAQKK